MPIGYSCIVAKYLGNSSAVLVVDCSSNMNFISNRPHVSLLCLSTDGCLTCYLLFQVGYKFVHLYPFSCNLMM